MLLYGMPIDILDSFTIFFLNTLTLYVYVKDMNSNPKPNSYGLL